MTFETAPEEQPGHYMNELEDNCRRLAKENKQLQAENERLKREVEGWKDMATARLLENERLRKFVRDISQLDGPTSGATGMARQMLRELAESEGGDAD